jgi:hypothetical protein
MISLLGMVIQTPTVQAIGPCGGTFCVYLPIIQKALDCSTGQSYGTSLTAGSMTDIPAAQHPDLNLAVRSYVSNSQSKQLVYYSPDEDPAAPRLATFFSPPRLPAFSNTYDVYDWNWPPPAGTGSLPYGSRGALLSTLPNGWPTTLLGLQTTIGEVISLPERVGANVYIDPLNRQARVLYAESHRITFKYGSEDNVVAGYTLHVENVCVDPNLVALYNQLNVTGRTYLPALLAKQPFGRANGVEIRATVRDNGSFGDPRSCRDNWVGVGANLINPNCLP